VTGDSSTTPVVVRIRRSGGLAGIAVTRTAELGDLPEDDAVQWRALLDGGLRVLAAEVPGRPIPDAFSYHLACPPEGDEVTLAEHDLPGPVRDLFDRTLET
jgi:hypothetical protein